MDNTPLPAVPLPAASGKTPLGLDETINDVNSSTSDYIFRTHRKTAIIFGGILLAWLVIGTILCLQYGFGGAAFYFLLGPPFGAIVVYTAIINNKILHEFYRQFAAANNMSYQKDGQLALEGALFNLGHSHRTSDIISGAYDGNPLVLFNYTYIIGTGKNQQTYHDTVFKIQYPSILPPILLVVDSQYFGGLVGMFSDWEKIQPEGDFDKTFNLYTKKGLEIETLQVFSPDFMEKMLSEYPEFNLEFNGNNLIVFHNRTITTKAELQKMYTFVEFLISKIEPEAKRMAGSVADLEALQNH